jgi:hypothetical protein
VFRVAYGVVSLFHTNISPVHPGVGAWPYLILVCGCVHGETFAGSLALNFVMKYIVNFSVMQLPSPLKRHELQMIDISQAMPNVLFSIR